MSPGDVLVAVPWWREAAGLLLGIIIGGLGTWLALRHRRGRERELEVALQEARADLAAYQRQVDSHFTRAGELLQAMTSSYRSVYEHLAQGAHTLCQGDPRLPNLDLARVTHQQEDTKAVEVAPPGPSTGEAQRLADGSRRE